MDNPKREQEQLANDSRRGRPGTLRLGRIAGVQVGFHWSWFLIAILLTMMLATGYFPQAQPEWGPGLRWTLGIITTVIFFGSVLVHELAHALVARRRGIPVPAITLFFFGGVSEMTEQPHQPRDEFWVAIAGPLTSFGLMLLFAALAAGAAGLGLEAAQIVFSYLAIINLLLGLFNLLPGYPLDGGRVLRSILWRRRSRQDATRIAAQGGRVVAGLLILLGFVQLFRGAGGLWLVLIGLLLWGAATASRMQEA